MLREVTEWVARKRSENGQDRAAGRRAKTSTQVLTRRVKQGVAEWYVIEMLGKAWDGFETHTEQGYNVGKAVVRKSFGWRVAERLGYQAIADRLNEDLVTNPPPTPVVRDNAVGMWTYSNVRDMLTNPKHTGHMVWNRRARKSGGKNRMNPVSEWVWSPEPTHEANIDLETFVQAQQIAEQRERSRTASESRDPQAKRTYRLRSHIFCVLCKRRLYGKTKHQHVLRLCAERHGSRRGTLPRHTG